MILKIEACDEKTPVSVTPGVTVTPFVMDLAQSTNGPVNKHATAFIIKHDEIKVDLLKTL